MTQPSSPDIERFICAFEILSGFEAQQRELRGWGAFHASWPRPDPSCIRVLEWLKEITQVKPMRHPQVEAVMAPVYPGAVDILSPLTLAEKNEAKLPDDRAKRMELALGLIVAWEEAYPPMGGRSRMRTISLGPSICWIRMVWTSSGSSSCAIAN